MKRVLLVVAILTLLLLAACQPVADARSQACDAMRDASQKLATTRSAVMGLKPIQTVTQVRITIKQVRRDLDTARSIQTTVKGGGDEVQMMKALDQMEAGMQGASDQTAVSQLQDKLAGPVTAAQQSAVALYDAACAAK